MIMITGEAAYLWYFVTFQHHKDFFHGLNINHILSLQIIKINLIPDKDNLRSTKYWTQFGTTKNFKKEDQQLWRKYQAAQEKSTSGFFLGQTPKKN